ncbi:MAG: carbohydrate ABC transporter permease [Caldilineaceae bacterium]|jgi:multiple sugar transport system permease protein/sn-glycerol 3-phosphate transport system permease protein
MLSSLRRAQRGIGEQVPPSTAAFAYLILGAMALIVGFPFFWMVMTSLKEITAVFDFTQVFPPQPQWINYVNAWQKAPFNWYLFNSTFTAVAILVGQFATIIPAGYGFARLEFPGRDALFVLILATMMVPIQITFIPAFVIISDLGWKDSYLALIVPFFTSAFGIFLLRQSFKQIHQDFLDAARLDGCGHIGVMRHVLVPLTLPTLITFGLFSFVYHFNDLFWPLIVTDSQLMRTMPMGLSSFIEFEGGTQWNELMAASVFSMLPLIIVFLFAQSFFIKGIASAGLKG